MKKTRTLFLLSALLPLACGPTDVQDDAADERALAVARSSLLTLDSSALFDVPGTGIPEQRLRVQAFDADRIRQSLVQSDEKFEVAGQSGTRLNQESADWRMEVDAARGITLVLRKTPPPVGVAVSMQDEAALRRQAASRLTAWGIPAAELGQGSQQRAMQQEMTRGEKPGEPLVHSHKTFFFRTLNGVRVEGHRAVVSHGVDGSFYRALVKWPALASSGHLLHTPLDRSKVESLAHELLASEGITTGYAQLYWQYTPTLLKSGEAVLKLEAVVRVSNDVLGEPRVFTLDVGAVP